MIVGLICAFNEADRISGAVASLTRAGCDRVTVVDGAWLTPGGAWFGGAEWPYSTDGTLDAAQAAGASVATAPESALLSDGKKRDWALHNSGAEPNDHILFLDADERIHGHITDPPAGHGLVMLRNRPDELGFRTPWLNDETLETVPLLRWLRYSEMLLCKQPGIYYDKHGRVEPYLDAVLAGHARIETDEALAQAYRAVRDHRHLLPAEAWTVLPILDGLLIEHLPADPSKTEAKRAYYQEPVAA